MTQTATERRQEIGKVISEAMTDPKVSDVNWARESPAITEAERQLNEAMTLFVEGAASKMDVKAAYKSYVNACRGGLF